MNNLQKIKAQILEDNFGKNPLIEENDDTLVIRANPDFPIKWLLLNTRKVFGLNTGLLFVTKLIFNKYSDDFDIDGYYKFEDDYDIKIYSSQRIDYQEEE